MLAVVMLSGPRGAIGVGAGYMSSTPSHSGLMHHRCRSLLQSVQRGREEADRESSTLELRTLRKIMLGKELI